MKHSAEAFALNLKAYISTVLPMLKCLMDFQITNGRAMLLKYVTKWQDGISTEALYVYDISGSQAAVRYVMEMKPAEPEMWRSLSSIKLSWSCSCTKRYTRPFPAYIDKDNISEKY